MVVEIISIELKEPHHQHTQVLRGIDYSSPDLWVHLQKRNRQTNDAVTPESTTEHLVHRTQTQERLDDEHKRTEGRKFFQESEDHSARLIWLRLMSAERLPWFVTNLMIGTLAFAMIVTLFVIPARFIVFAKARRTVILFMYAMVSDWMTKSILLAHSG